MFKYWQIIEYRGVWWVFRGGALLDAGTQKFALHGGRWTAEELATLLNAKAEVR